MTVAEFIDYLRGRQETRDLAAQLVTAYQLQRPRTLRVPARR